MTIRLEQGGDSMKYSSYPFSMEDVNAVGNKLKLLES